MMPARLEVDFVAKRSRLPLSGLLFLLVGLGVAGWTFTDLRDVNASSDILAMTLERYEAKRDDRSQRLPDVDAADIEAATRRLVTPWSPLLQDLEAAAIDSDKKVALLEVAPDKEKRSVRLSGEARSLNDVLIYVTRLQQAKSLLFPILENHEIQTSDKERPVRFVIVAEWSIRE